MDITKFKTQASWGKDPMKDVETKVKSAFTRQFNKCGLPVKTTIMVEDAKKSKGGKKAAAVEPGDPEIGGEVAEVWTRTWKYCISTSTAELHVHSVHQQLWCLYGNTDSGFCLDAEL